MSEASDITVVSVEEMRRTGTWRVHFSEPVHRWGFGKATSLVWHVKQDHIHPDPLSAYLWGQRVIQAHTRRVAEEQSIATGS